MMEGRDETFDAVTFVGYHGKAGSDRGSQAHTGSGVLRDLQVNGRSAGKGGMNALPAEWCGVPVVLITGDDVAVDWQREVTPGDRGAAREAVAAARKTGPAGLKPLVPGPA